MPRVQMTPEQQEQNRRDGLVLVTQLRAMAQAEANEGPPTLTIGPLDAALLVELFDSMLATSEPAKVAQYPSSSTPPAPSTYSPPPEMLARAERILASATPGELVTAAHLYQRYQVPTDGRSAVTGAELPGFEVNRPLVKACWIETARAALTLHGAPPSGGPGSKASDDAGTGRPPGHSGRFA